MVRSRPADEASIDNRVVGTHTSPHIIYGEQPLYDYHMVESSIERPSWQPRGGGGRLAGMGLVFILGNYIHRRRVCRVSYLAGAFDWPRLGLDHAAHWHRESCLAHQYYGASPLYLG